MVGGGELFAVFEFEDLVVVKSIADLLHSSFLALIIGYGRKYRFSFASDSFQDFELALVDRSYVGCRRSGLRNKAH